MSWEAIFGLANGLAMLSWGALIALPRWPWLMQLLRYAVPGLLATAYASLVFYFFQVDGAGFTTMAGVRALLSTEPTLLAGWIHYLAFDLLVGTLIAEEQDRLGISRFLQAPVLFLTFLFGPLGYLAHLGMAGGARYFAGRSPAPEATS